MKPQGSFIIGTTIQSIEEDGDIDLDVVCEFKRKKNTWTQYHLKKAVGDHLKSHGMYSNLLDEEGRRCWTLKYREEGLTNQRYHMDNQSHIVTLNSNIGAHTPNIHYSIISQSLLPDYYPAVASNIDLGTVNTLNKDSDPNFWNIEEANLQQRFDRLLFPLLNSGEIKHISLFGFGPIPMLIKLGSLLNDITSVDVRQKRRNPDTWNFDDDIETNYNFSPASNLKSQVVLKIELSDNIADERITSILTDDVSIYSLNIDHPDNDFVKSRKQIIDFGNKMKEAFREIKRIHGQNAVLNVFPAMPISLAVQLGRVWMPKADLSMKIFDQNFALGGFVEALKIKHY